MTIKEQTENFMQHLILTDNALEKRYLNDDERREYMSGLLYWYISSVLQSLVFHNNSERKELSAKMFGDSEADAVKEIIEAVTSGCENACKRFGNSGVNALFEFMTEISDRHTFIETDNTMTVYDWEKGIEQNLNENYRKLHMSKK